MLEIMRKAKNIARVLLPVYYDKPFKKNAGYFLLNSFGLQRSGQHVIIDWICRGLTNVIHFNNCYFHRKNLSHILTPLTGRRVVYHDDCIDDSGAQGRKNFYSSLPSDTFKALFYSMEDKSLREPLYKKLTKSYDTITIIILRDPANWLASSIKAELWTQEQLLKKRNILIEYLEEANISTIENKYLFVNYNAFICSIKYRKKLANKLNLVSFSKAEEALKYTPNFGGGSSFKNDSGNTLNRWKNYQHNHFYRKILNNSQLYDLASNFFGKMPGFPMPR